MNSVSASWVSVSGLPIGSAAVRSAAAIAALQHVGELLALILIERVRDLGERSKERCADRAELLVMACVELAHLGLVDGAATNRVRDLCARLFGFTFAVAHRFLHFVVRRLDHLLLADGCVECLKEKAQRDETKRSAITRCVGAIEVGAAIEVRAAMPFASAITSPMSTMATPASALMIPMSAMVTAPMAATHARAARTKDLHETYQTQSTNEKSEHVASRLQQRAG